jgi:hypothetical protein
VAIPWVAMMVDVVSVSKSAVGAMSKCGTDASKELFRGDCGLRLRLSL